MQAFTQNAFPKFYTIQFLRFVAALFVMLFHYSIMQSGYKGVEIFFVISGFVLYYSTLIATHKSAKVFLINRLTKIYILYWVVLLTWYCFMPFKIDAVFLNSFFLIPGHFPFIEVSWSLSYELYFYFVFAVIVYLIRQKVQVIFFCLFILSTVVTFLQFTPLSAKGSLLNFLLDEHFWEFLLGILCCMLAFKVSIDHRLALVLCGIAGLAITFIYIPYATTLGHVVFGPLAFLLVFFIVQYEKKAVLNKHLITIITILGDASYAIYLTSPLVGKLIAPVQLYSKVLTMLLVITISIIINRYAETPLLTGSRRALKKLGGRK